VIGGAPVHFELLVEDDQADPRIGTVVAQRLVDAGIAGMIGHFNSGTSIPASRICAEAGIPQIAMATTPAYTAQGYKTAFRAKTNDTQQGAVMGRFAVAKLHAKRIAVIDDRTAYGQGLAEEFDKAARAAGGEIVKREYTAIRTRTSPPSSLPSRRESRTPSSSAVRMPKPAPWLASRGSSRSRPASWEVRW
jgi:branched-chain amino acid transport system substrate-binding protein